MKSEYDKMLKELEEGLQTCLSELVQIQRRKAWFEQAIAGVKGIMGNEEDNPGAVGITQAIRDLLYQNPIRWVSAPTVRDKLRKVGFPINGYTQPLAVIHTTLMRLKKQGELDWKMADGKTEYRWASEEKEEE